MKVKDLGIKRREIRIRGISHTKMMSVTCFSVNVVPGIS